MEFNYNIIIYSLTSIRVDYMLDLEIKAEELVLTDYMTVGGK